MVPSQFLTLGKFMSEQLAFSNLEILRARPRPDVLYQISAMLELTMGEGTRPIYYAWRRLADGNHTDLGEHETIEKALEVCQEDFDKLPAPEESRPRVLRPRPARPTE